MANLASPRAVLEVETGCATFVGGTKTVAASATPEKLVAASTPCRAVWIAARQTNGTAGNTGICLIGDADTQNIPVLTTDFTGYTIKIDDASKIYVHVAVAGEGVVYRILA